MNAPSGCWRMSWSGQQATHTHDHGNEILESYAWLNQSARLSSTAGSEMTEKRTRPTCDNLETLVYLHEMLSHQRSHFLPLPLSLSPSLAHYLSRFVRTGHR